MADVRPFPALRPPNQLAAEVIAPPYDVLSEAEARKIAENRKSFVRITRSEVDLPEGTDSHSDIAYVKAAENLALFEANGWLARDAEATYYLYGQKMGDHEQVGVLGGASVAEYDDGRIAKHEFTRPDKEDDRTHHMNVLGAQVGLVFLAYRPHAALDDLIAEVSAGKPAWETTTEDDVVHKLWPVPADKVEAFRQALAGLERLYIADGHHRSAAASRIRALRKSEASEHFLAGMFPADRLQVMAYNRIVDSLNGHSPAAFLEAVAAKFDVSTGVPTPAQRGDVSMYFEGAWHTLRLKEAFRSDDAVKKLDASALQDHLLAPLLGIKDPRRATGIRFVGGIHGHKALSDAVDAGAAVAFHLFPTGLDQLFEVADAGEVMPPKSTWFEPKLREGVVVRSL